VLKKNGKYIESIGLTKKEHSLVRGGMTKNIQQPRAVLVHLKIYLVKESYFHIPKVSF
jgi:hypothetical protein